MKTVKISLNSIDKVKAFVNEVTKYDAEFDLVSGRYVIDAKSIMGIFSLDVFSAWICQNQSTSIFTARTTLMKFLLNLTSSSLNKKYNIGFVT